MSADRRLRVGLLFVMAGLVMQIAASFFWSPGTFILSAAVGAPLVLAGAVLSWLGTRRQP